MTRYVWQLTQTLCRVWCLERGARWQCVGCGAGWTDGKACGTRRRQGGCGGGGPVTREWQVVCAITRCVEQWCVLLTWQCASSGCQLSGLRAAHSYSIPLLLTCQILQANNGWVNEGWDTHRCNMYKPPSLVLPVLVLILLLLYTCLLPRPAASFHHLHAAGCPEHPQ